MAQFLSLLTALLLFAVFSPTVCPSGQMYTEIRDRSPYISSNEHIPQYFGDSQASRVRNAPSHKNINMMNYRSYEQQAPYLIVMPTIYGPVLYPFKNAAPIASPSHMTSYTGQMLADQPQPEPHEQQYASTASNDKEFFKLSNGDLSPLYNQDYVSRYEKNKPNYSDKTSGKESYENRFQSYFPAGLQMHKHASQSATINRKDSVYFPTEQPTMEEFSYAVDTNDCVEEDVEKNGKPFCTNLRNYPKKTHLEKIIKQKFVNLESFFGEDFVLQHNNSDRVEHEPNEKFLCESRTRVIYPQAGLNKDYDWRVIVNIPNYKQGIRIEECLNEQSTCGESNGLSLPNNYTATCKQSYIYRSLVAYTNDTVIKDHFKMPSCCKCVLRTG